MIITDSGSHIWRAASAENPWMPGRTAHLPTPIGYEDILRMMAEAFSHDPKRTDEAQQLPD